MQRKKIFFRNNGLSPFEILKFSFSSNNSTLNWPQFINKKIIYTHLGRIGNILACQLWNIKKGDEILVPSYNCGSEVDPFLWYGMNAKMYRVDSNLNIDPDDLNSRITEKTRIIYVIHYFGWPQLLKEIPKLYNQNKIFLIEDCALSLFSNGPAGPIGMEGDAAIYSFRKTLPVPDGAALVLPLNTQVNSVPDKNPNRKVIIKETVPYLARWFINQMSNISVLNNLLYGNGNSKIYYNSDLLSDRIDMPEDYYFSENILRWTISGISAAILRATYPEMVYKKRRDNYIRLYNGISNIKNLKPLLDPLPEGVCPLLMPVIVKHTFQWINELNKKGIKAIRWWEGFNQKLSWDNFPEAKNLKHNLLVLPVHQYLNEDDVDYMIKCIREVSV